MGRLVCLCLLLTAAAAAAAPVWEAEGLGYLHDLEFFEDAAQHQEGRTYFGQQLVLRAAAAPADGLRLEAGLLLDVQFGRDVDENRDATEPWLALELDLGGPVLRFGNLDRRRQDLHHALIAPGLRYTRPADRGFSLRGAGARTDYITWLQWRVQEREDRRELFDAGARGLWRLGDAPTAPALDAQLHVVHKGGQLSSVGFLEESWALLAGPVWTPEIAAGWSLDLAVRAGACADRRWRHDGRAAELRLGLRHRGWRAAAARWWSEDWTTMDGRPLYRADGVTGLELSRRWRRGPLAVDLGARLHRVAGDTESEFWLLMDLGTIVLD
ncbi:MAG TPA: hypothetical protein PLH84_04815 [Candidatus Krumholzibacteria bacterium]|nr:hypothetical protein [Candidatus Krumholzibacteria bacterium]